MLIVGNNLSTWLARELNNRAWSARELGRRIGMSGTSISRYLEGSLNPSPQTCRKLAIALGADPQEVMRLAGHLPPVPPAVREEDEAITILRSLSPNVRAIAMRMLHSLRPDISYTPPSPHLTLAESPSQYSSIAPIQTRYSMNQEIAYLIEQYPDLAPLFDEAQRTLPEHAIKALIYNVIIWIREKEKREAFATLHQRLSVFLGS